MIDRDQLAEAVRYNDALAEESSDGEGEGVVRVLTELGIGTDAAAYVAYQRGLRALAIVKGGDPEVWGVIASTGGLTAEQKEIVAVMASLFLDGLACHARAAQVASRGDG